MQSWTGWKRFPDSHNRELVEAPQSFHAIRSAVRNNGSALLTFSGIGVYQPSFFGSIAAGSRRPLGVGAGALIEGALARPPA